MTNNTCVKSLILVALYAGATVDAMYQPRLQCKTCAEGEAPDKPTPDNKDTGGKTAPSTPRPTK